MSSRYYVKRNHFVSTNVGLAIDVISKCAFGVESDAQNKPDQDIIKWGNEAVQGFRISSWIEEIVLYICFFFPGVDKYLPVIPTVSPKAVGDTVGEKKNKKKTPENYCLGKLIEYCSIIKRFSTKTFPGAKHYICHMI